MKFFYFFSNRQRLNALPKISLKYLIKLDKSQWQNFFFLLISGFIFAVMFCLWIYIFSICSQYFNAQAESSAHILCALIMSLCGILSIFVWIVIPKRIRFYFGFFCGVLLFYWVGLSFRYTPAPYLVGVVICAMGIAYGIIFYLALFFQSRIYRIISLIALGFIYPFGFDWFVPQAFLSYSLFGVHLWQYTLLCVGVLLLCIRWQSRIFTKLIGIICILASIDFGIFNQSTSRAINPFFTTQTTIIQTEFAQDFKWEVSSLDIITQNVFDAIDTAIAESKQMIIFPETILPFALNQSYAYPESILTMLKAKSEKIAIIIGAFNEQDSRIFNSTYVIYKQKVSIFNKVILAPFGEKIPLPDFLSKPLYKFFWNLEDGLVNAKTPQDFELFGMKFRNAICYEGTSRQMYKDYPKNLIMISNNGWFYPSIEPLYQRILLKYYARMYGTTILHSINYSESMIISPILFGDSPSSAFMPLISYHTQRRANAH